VNIFLGVCSRAFSEMRNLLNFPCLIYIFRFYNFLDMDDDAHNLNEMVINSLVIVYDIVSYFY